MSAVAAFILTSPTRHAEARRRNIRLSSHLGEVGSVSGSLGPTVLSISKQVRRVPLLRLSFWRAALCCLFRRGWGATGATGITSLMLPFGATCCCTAVGLSTAMNPHPAVAPPLIDDHHAKAFRRATAAQDHARLQDRTVLQLARNHLQPSSHVYVHTYVVIGRLVAFGDTRRHKLVNIFTAGIAPRN